MVRVGYNSSNFNISRMLRILSRLGNPHRVCKTVHIAGTKGKGSTAHMVAAMLKKSGYRTGLYTSPHFLDLRERISIDNQLVTESEFARLMARIAPVADKLAKDKPTFFDLMYGFQARSRMPTLEEILGWAGMPSLQFRFIGP